MSAHPVLIRNPMQPDGTPSELLLVHDGRAYQSRPALYYVDGPFVDDGGGGAIAAAMAADGGRGYLNGRGEWIVAPTLQDAQPFGPDGLSLFRDQDRWGYRNLKGDVVVAAQYEKAEAFSFGLAAVMIGERKWRYIDTRGEFAFDGFLRHAGPFTAIGLAVARGGSYKCGYIDRSGAWAIAPRFEHPAPFSRHGVAPASENGSRFGIINQQGEWVLAPCYDQIDAFDDDGLAWFKADDNQEGYLDAAGVPVIRDCHDLSRTMRHGVAVERAAQMWYRSADDVHQFGEAFDWAGDFNTHGFALARAVDPERGPVWGIARLDGTFAVVPADVLEPLPDWNIDIGDPEPGTPLIAFLARDGSIALLDRDARLAFRLRAESEDGGERVALYDQTGRQLWQDAPCAELHTPQPYFSAPAHAFLAEVRHVDDLPAYAETMLAATRAKLLNIDALKQAAQNGETETDDATAYKSGPDDCFSGYSDTDDEGRLARLVRTRRRIFRMYLGEAELTRYEFLGDDRYPMVLRMLERCVERLSAHFGAPVSDPDYAGAEPDRDTLAWRIGALWLGIAGIHENGDGDAWQHIWLLCAPSQAAFNAALAGQQPSSFDPI